MGENMQQYIQATLDSMKQMLNTSSPTNSFYLPTWLTTPPHVYDPYGKDHAMIWAFSLSGKDMMAAASTICGDILTGDSSLCPLFSIGDPSLTPTLTLGGNSPGDMLVSGFSNVSITTLEAVGSGIPMQINAELTFSTLMNAPQYPVVSGNFALVQHCCCSSDNVTCSSGGSSTPYTGTGTFTATVNGSCTAAVTAYITNLANNVLEFSVTEIVLSPPLQNNIPNISTDVKIIDSNIPSKALPSYDNLAEEAFNSNEAKQMIISQINAVMNLEGQLSAMGAALTKIVDDYLQQNGKYPFGPMQSAMLY